MNALANMILLACAAVVIYWVCGGFERDNGTYPHQRIVTLQEYEMDQVIDESLAKAEAHKIPKNVLYMVELYGTDKESTWAFNTMKDR